MKFAKLALISALTITPVVPATAAGLSYSFIDARYISINIDDTDVDATGFGVGGSVLVGDQIYIKAGYSAVETDDINFFGTTGSIKIDEITAGLGIRMPLGPATDLNADAAWLRYDAEGQGGFAGGGMDAEDGFDLGVRVRHLFTPMFEANLAVDYVEVDDEDDTVLSATALVHFTENFALVGAYGTASDSDQWSAGGRFNFGS